MAEDPYDSSAPMPPQFNNVAGREVLEEEARKVHGRVKIPTGQTTAEAAEMWHLSEGSDVFPLKWFQNMESATSSEPGTLLSEDLDKKFQIIKEPENFAKGHEHPVKYVGVSVGMSEEHPDKSDMHVPVGIPLNSLDHAHRSSMGGTSIPMVGTNCTFCHTGQITLNGKTSIVEGAPGVVNVRGFFQDLAGSAAKTMLDEDTLRKFLEKVVYPKDKVAARAVAKEFSGRFQKELGLTSDSKLKTGLQAGVVGGLGYLDQFTGSDKVKEAKVGAVKAALFKHRDITQKYLTELLMMSYPKTENGPALEDSQTIDARMEWLARLMGTDPSIKTTPEVYGSNDAFGRIANLTARREHGGPLTGDVSIPAIWSMTDRDLFHWNANTNSISLRDAGQATGLGAVYFKLLSGQVESTINFSNLYKEQELVNKIQVPNWTKLGGDVNMDKAIRGCKKYQITCAKCHNETKRVGPTGELINYKMFSLAELGTDPNQTLNQAKPVDGVPFRQALLGAAETWRQSFYDKYKIDPATQCKWEDREKRGSEAFRDTGRGENAYPPGSEMDYFNIAKGMGYPARGLSGVWATAPFLHNGSVPNLEALLSPSTKRPKTFIVGSREIDSEKLGFANPDVEDFPFTEADKAQILKLMDSGIGLRRTEEEAKIELLKTKYSAAYVDTALDGNSNKGHEGARFGTNLKPNEKADLIEFMKILRPESEYSWNEAPTYRVKKDGINCEKVNSPGSKQ